MKENEILFEKIKKEILNLKLFLKEIVTVGIFGSLAREKGFNKRSDIDIFIIVEDEKYSPDLQDRYFYFFSKIIYEKYKRDVTVCLHSISGIKKVPSWETLGLVSEGKIIYDKNNIADIFKRIKEKAYENGLEEIESGNQIIWRIKPPVKRGTRIKFELD